jgi:hypothetical protein
MAEAPLQDTCSGSRMGKSTVMKGRRGDVHRGRHIQARVQTLPFTPVRIVTSSGRRSTSTIPTLSWSAAATLRLAWRAVENPRQYQRQTRVAIMHGRRSKTFLSRPRPGATGNRGPERSAVSSSHGRRGWPASRRITARAPSGAQRAGPFQRQVRLQEPAVELAPPLASQARTFALGLVQDKRL